MTELITMLVDNNYNISAFVEIVIQGEPFKESNCRTCKYEYAKHA